MAKANATITAQQGRREAASDADTRGHSQALTDADAAKPATPCDPTSSW